MKLLVKISRIIVGLLFIFSGLVKANDPHGLSYKMQEFFEVWSSDASLTTFMHWLSHYALPFSIIMITLEILVGVGILLGVWKNFFTTLLLILIIFFAFLTGYAALSGKIATCGCFGDCIPLSSMESFIKDLVLLVLVLILFFGKKYIVPILTPAINVLLLIISCALVLFYQWYVMRHLPTVDCLPFKKGGNVLRLRKMPADAVPDVKDYKFVYEKGGKKQNFTIRDLPDSTWKFVSREDFIVKKGENNEPPIKDFYFTTLSGNDTTDAVLSLDATYYLFFVKSFSNTDNWLDNFTNIYDYAKKNNRLLYIVTPENIQANNFFNVRNNFRVPVFSLDATAFKTAARTDPELYLMHGPVIKNKWGWADFKLALKN
ncbi:MAG TPA: BT_3928 family protein [Hanamia sp.]|nr:BT_3928 family protein [Hanamia sp.]